MATKIKGICKGSFKYISHLFVEVKERELEIGLPTDVKHVAHIGWDGPDGTAPSWMSDFKSGSDVALASFGSIGGSGDNPTWSSQDFEQLGRQQSTKLSNLFPPSTPNSSSLPKKQKRKKTTKSSNSTPKAKSSSSSRSSRSSKHKSLLCDSEEGDVVVRHSLKR